MSSLLFCAILLSASPDAQWPAFLGGQSVASENIPLACSPKHIAWSKELPGYGQSSPIVWNNQVFLTSIAGTRKEKCHVLALNVQDGELLWKHTFDAAEQAENNNYVSKAAPTPTTDGESVFAFFESGDVLALGMDGTERWKRSLTADYGKFTTRHGLAASPLLAGDALILLLDHEGPSYLLALDKRTGKTLWKTDRSSRTSWSSPALLTIGGTPTIVCSSTGSVDGYSPSSGELLWTYDEVGGNTTNTPIAFGEDSFLVGAGTGKKSNLALRVELVAGKWTPQVLWSSNEASSSFGSPIVYAGHAYFVNKAGVLFCLDAKTGDLKYTERLKQTIWATPLGSGDRVFFFGKGGLVTVIATGPQFKVLAESELWTNQEKAADPPPAEGKTPAEGKAPAARSEIPEPVLYGVAVAGDSLLLRRGDRLYRVSPR